MVDLLRGQRKYDIPATAVYRPSCHFNCPKIALPSRTPEEMEVAREIGKTRQSLRLHRRAREFNIDNYNIKYFSMTIPTCKIQDLKNYAVDRTRKKCQYVTSSQEGVNETGRFPPPSEGEDDYNEWIKSLIAPKNELFNRQAQCKPFTTTRLKEALETFGPS